MLTDQEMQALAASIDVAIEICNRMKSVIADASAKRNVVKKIIVAQKSIDEVSASNQISDFINLTSKIDEFIENVSIIKTAEKNIPNVFKTFIQKEFVLFDWKNLHLTQPYVTSKIKNFLEKQTANEIKVDQQDTSTINWLCDLPQKYSEYVSLFERKI